MEIKLTVDRIEEGIAICFDENENRYELTEDLCEGEIVTALIDDEGNIRIIERHISEAKEKKSKNASRLKALFNRGGNKE